MGKSRESQDQGGYRRGEVGDGVCLGRGVWDPDSRGVSVS